MSELRVFQSSDSSGEQERPKLPVSGSNLAIKLFRLMTSSNRKDRQKFNQIKNNFQDFTDGAEFEVVIRTKNSENVETRFGVLQSSEDSSPAEQFLPAGVYSEPVTHSATEACIQIIADDYPIGIEQTASGIQEILSLLTTIIGENRKVLLLDEPELHLHPTMQKRIYNLLLESIGKEENQIVLVTHSPYLTSAEKIDSTWRFSSTSDGTKVHNIQEVLSSLHDREQKKLEISLYSPDVRAILFSQGVIFVEGVSDKIVVEQVDRHLSAKGKGANIDENEWPIISMNTKHNLPAYMLLSQKLDVPSVAVLDYDALMHVEKTKIRTKEFEESTSTVMYTLWHTGKLTNPESYKGFSSKIGDNGCYSEAYHEEFKELANKNGIFVFPKDLEGVMQYHATNRKSKPLKALEKAIEFIKSDEIPTEFIEMCSFIKENMKATEKKQQQ
ncbi:MAG: AAA family ATPase [Candidatus Bathyarchaeota archaeon]|nr:AAA family ATPase [Candidatus Bathyarchaeota archaeon]